jgi:hypothetical protein
MKEITGWHYELMTEYNECTRNPHSRTFLFKIELRQPIRIKESACVSNPMERISCQYSISFGLPVHGRAKGTNVQ